MDSKICANCKEEIDGTFCSNCDIPIKVERINAKFYKNVIAGVFFLGWEALYTVKTVLIRPGKSIREYVEEDRSKLMNPITFLFLTLLFAALINFIFSIEPPDNQITINYVGREGFQSSYVAITGWLWEHQGIYFLIFGSFWSFWLYLFFKKQRYNFFEVLTLVCYVTGIVTLLDLSIDLVFLIETPKWLKTSIGILLVSYISWATARFFGNKSWYFIKSFFAFVLGYATIFLVKYFLSRLIDMIILTTMY